MEEKIHAKTSEHSDCKHFALLFSNVDVVSKYNWPVFEMLYLYSLLVLPLSRGWKRLSEEDLNQNQTYRCLEQTFSLAWGFEIASIFAPPFSNPENISWSFQHFWSFLIMKKSHRQLLNDHLMMVSFEWQKNSPLLTVLKIITCLLIYVSMRTLKWCTSKPQMRNCTALLSYGCLDIWLCSILQIIFLIFVNIVILVNNLNI